MPESFIKRPKERYPFKLQSNKSLPKELLDHLGGDDRNAVINMKTISSDPMGTSKIRYSYSKYLPDGSEGKWLCGKGLFIVLHGTELYADISRTDDVHILSASVSVYSYGFLSHYTPILQYVIHGKNFRIENGEKKFTDKDAKYETKKMVGWVKYLVKMVEEEDGYTKKVMDVVRDASMHGI